MYIKCLFSGLFLSYCCVWTVQIQNKTGSSPCRLLNKSSFYFRVITMHMLHRYSVCNINILARINQHGFGTGWSWFPSHWGLKKKATGFCKDAYLLLITIEVPLSQLQTTLSASFKICFKWIKVLHKLI